MHGLSQKEYATQEFMESYIEEKYIGCDVYGVWSRHYLKYFKELLSSGNILLSISFFKLLRINEHSINSLVEVSCVFCCVTV